MIHWIMEAKYIYIYILYISQVSWVKKQAPWVKLNFNLNNFKKNIIKKSKGPICFLNLKKNKSNL